MNFYKHHLGDYAGATAHLSFLEDAAYSRMLRHYYITEKPLPTEAAAVGRLVRAKSKQEMAAIEVVLNEFFTLEADGWHNKRCDEEIQQDRAFIEKQRLNGRASVAKRRLNGGSTVVEPNLNGGSTVVEPNLNGGPTVGQPPTPTPTPTPTPISESKSGCAAFSDFPPDPRQELWGLGTRLLGDGARSLIGQAIKRVGESKVGEVLGQMAAKPPAEAKPYFVKATQERGFVC